ncbi:MULTISPECIES: hybrid sensor histidine kinase/response regulator [unclassified Cupriavidus]|uniref:hybrid sensor histidine kinase/response regulator n=1 Tax=unclassified Cupriavidus TaxID=2640874 RepID=UPI001C0054C4|nr:MULTISPECIES: hybrid sensor histidine kinase/response regulator [unclassified Cupriavidus]MCA3183761.1 hybrid sensor histidine kinase/response regulator [Cupriavidus sp.]MCA3188791.1 hybrid sensor histidine kinase/response regulator [Cupriavidus sp.]MCA3198511.1 hybrid sensor histidine kinase/response regulator [Cupriavidus sp.]MCA3201257.1 hybrid sensor histidine kinase/response regulator [Cupriavidus sp.]MCA3208461.1 hybrid sensor histidine kinase/response regulator [Cupriavidus sp.]
MNPEQLRDASMLDLFALEADAQAEVLNAGLLALERDPTAASQLEACMRAAHSLKGAARIVGLDGGVRVAHVMEDCLVAAQRGGIVLAPAHIDALLQGTDLLQRIGHPPGGNLNWPELDGRAEIDAWIDRMNRLLDGDDAVPAPLPVHAGAESAAEPAAEPVFPPTPDIAHESSPAAAFGADAQERMLRVSADRLDRLLALAGEAMVESHWLRPFGGAMQQARRHQMRTLQALDGVQALLDTPEGSVPRMRAALAEVRQLLEEGHGQLSQRVDEFDQYDHRASRLSRRIYDTALSCRMRPLSDGMTGFSRMVRDLGRALGKHVHLVLSGEQTQVDRDILEQLDAPLAHLLRNAVDHGIELPEARRAAGKPEEGRITLMARHNAGRLVIEIFDDGAGVDLDALRAAIVRRGLAQAETAARLSQAEMLEFLLLPGFSLRETVSEVSGRGVGLDAVQDMVRAVRGSLKLSQQPGSGLHFHLELPLTLSVVRALLVEISGEAYAFPLGLVLRAVAVPRDAIEQTEQHQHFRHEGRPVGLVSAAQILQRPEPPREGDSTPVVVIGEQERVYGIAVDRLLGERMLVVQPLAQALGKIKDIAAGSMTDDGTPVLIFDVEDMLRSVEKLVSEGRIERVRHAGTDTVVARRKRVLVVDDSLTVRELERKLLAGRGYDVSVAVDGMDGWNVLRAEAFDLVITDVDMPRLDGIELVTRIRGDTRLAQLPVMIVSYKDREQDRERGMQAGADYYLAKGSFHDTALLDAVRDLIGEART